MLLQPRNKPIVFGGPSLRLAQQKYLHEFDYRKPVQRGDLHRLLQKADGRVGCVLITDGVFGESMAVAPAECMDLLRAGWQLIGASSMGALRAADCSKVGMVGIGEIFFGYQMAYFHSDADVAVMYNTADYTELSVSFAHADFIARRLAQQFPLAGLKRRLLLRDLRAIPWFERSAHVVANQFASHFAIPELYQHSLTMLRDPAFNPKVADALLACDMLAKFYLKKYIPDGSQQ